MQKRTLGRTGERLSVIGFGGIVVKDESPAHAASMVEHAVERGINYFDVAPTYGNAEERLGPALEPFRDRVFLACKTTDRSAIGAEAELQRSLAMLRTDRFDLYQLHGVAKMEDAETALAPGGALEALIRAKARGQIRHIGFSAHSEAAALRLLEAFDFDSVMIPINLFCWTQGGFGPAICEKAAGKGAGILALKAMARRPLKKDEPRAWPKCWYVPFDRPDDIRAAVSFTLSKPVTAALTPGHADLLWMACDAAETLEQEPVGHETPEGEPLFRTDL